MKSLNVEKIESIEGGGQPSGVQKFCSFAAAVALIEPTPLGEAAVLGCLVHCIIFC